VVALFRVAVFGQHRPAVPSGNSRSSPPGQDGIRVVCLSVAVISDGVDHVGQAPIAPFRQGAQLVERCRVRAVVLGPGDQLPTVDREGKSIEHVAKTVGNMGLPA